MGRRRSRFWSRPQVIALLVTPDMVKISAVQAVLAEAGVAFDLFDAAVGSMWGSAVPRRLMVDEGDLGRARLALAAAGFVEARDGEWDLRA
jgi:Putative prokaryotic signal transducing protein